MNPLLENGHLSEQAIRAYASGSQPLQDTEAIIGHLSYCSQCRDVWIAQLHKTNPKDIPNEIVGYHDIEPIGSGGMGSVYSAVQNGTQRKVAIKCIRIRNDHLGVDPENARRALREARALAKLAHPNIVSVLEVLLVQQTPALVMEHVWGIPLDSWIKKHKPSPDLAVQIALQLTDAIQHAHLRGVLHCDLKPQNVLVETRPAPVIDYTPHVKLIDFGLAKLHQEDWLITHPGDVLGTPAYMPPEKASGKLTKANAAIDIYGLGAILYELLTQRPPFVTADRSELLAQLLTEPPTPPSHTNPNVPSSLDAICLKCLEKQPSARYETISALSDDLLAYIHKEPISASRSARWSSTTRWVKKNQTLAYSIVCFLGVVLCLLPLTLYQNHFNRELNAKSKTESERRLTAQKRADQAEQSLLEELRTNLQEMSQRVYGSHPFRTTQDRQLILNILGRWQSFANRLGDTPQSKTLRAEAFLRIAIAHNILGDRKFAEENFQEAINLLNPLFSEAPSQANRQFLAECYHQIAILRNEQGDLRTTMEYLQKAIHVWSFPTPTSPLQSTNQLELQFRLQIDAATFLILQHQFEQATQQLETAKKLLCELREASPVNPKSVSSILECKYVNTQVMLLRAQGNIDEAIRILVDTSESSQALISADEVNSEALEVYARHQTLLGISLKEIGRFNQAIESICNAIALQRKLLILFPSIPLLRHQLGTNLNVLAFIESQRGMMKYAIDASTESLEIHTQLHETYPENPNFRFEQANALNNLVALHIAMTDWDQANKYAPQLLETRRAILASQPDRIDFKNGLAATLNIVGALFDKTNQKQQAANLFAEALQLYEALILCSPTTQEFRSGLAKTQLLRAEFASDAKRWQEAVALFTLAITAFHDQAPHSIRVDQAFIRRCYLGQAGAYEALGDPKAMQDCLDQAKTLE